MWSKLPVIWSCGTGQQISCFDRCQLTITWMYNTKDVHCKPRLHASSQGCIVATIVIGHMHLQFMLLDSYLDHEKLVARCFISIHAMMWFCSYVHSHGALPGSPLELFYCVRNILTIAGMAEHILKWGGLQVSARGAV